MEILLSKVKRVLLEDQKNGMRLLHIETENGDIVIGLHNEHKKIPIKRKRLED